MPLQPLHATYLYLVTKRIHAIIYLVNISIWLLREYMPLQHIYLVTKRIHAIATYLFGY